jgi:hypothetical protein
VSADIRGVEPSADASAEEIPTSDPVEPAPPWPPGIGTASDLLWILAFVLGTVAAAASLHVLFAAAIALFLTSLALRGAFMLRDAWNRRHR